MGALVGIDDDGRGLDQFNGVDSIVPEANGELEDGREVALIAVVGLVAAAGAGKLPRLAIFTLPVAIVAAAYIIGQELVDVFGDYESQFIGELAGGEKKRQCCW